MSEPIVIAQISDLHCGSRYHIPQSREPRGRRAQRARAGHGDRDRRPDRHGLSRASSGRRTGCSSASSARARWCSSATTTRATWATSTSRSCSARGASSSSSTGCASSGWTRASPTSTRDASDATCYRWLEERFAIDHEEFKVVAMHHHLVPVPGTGRERNIVHDAGDLLRVLADNGVDLVLCGHKHVPNVWRLEDMLIVNAGTCCTHRLRGKVRPSLQHHRDPRQAPTCGSCARSPTSTPRSSATTAGFTSTSAAGGRAYVSEPGGHAAGTGDAEAEA